MYTKHYVSCAINVFRKIKKKNEKKRERKKKRKKRREKEKKKKEKSRKIPVSKFRVSDRARYYDTGMCILYSVQHVWRTLVLSMRVNVRVQPYGRERITTCGCFAGLLRT